MNSRGGVLIAIGLLSSVVANPLQNRGGRNALVRVESPGEKLEATVRVGPYGRLEYDVAFSPKLVVEPYRLGVRVTPRGKPVIERSDLGLLMDRINLGEGVTISQVERYQDKQSYPWHGVHSAALNHFRGSRISVRHLASHTTYTVDLRAFDNAVAFRFTVPGDQGARRVPDAASSFNFPKGSVVWYHDLGDHYEGVHIRKEIEKVEAGDWAGPPITAKLPDGGGYAAITEAALLNYAGMVLRADGRLGFREALAHEAPVGYPFTLRFGEDEAKRLSAPAPIVGPITTPWRVIMAGPDLNTLVNSDAVHNLSPPPDKSLFPDGAKTSWIRPGRAVWRYLDGGENTLAGIREFSRLAGELGFEYNLVEGLWQKWTEAELRDLVEYSASQNVRIWVWRHSRTLRDGDERRKLFASLKKAGIVGVKVDFLDHEAKEIIDVYQAVLRDAAEHQLMINFHGANKPAGEPRTWPNEMTREGIYGLEHKRMEAWAVFNTIWPFTRMLAGHADYTPMVFGERRRETSWAHQIATAAVVTSPVLVYGAHPESILSHPAADLIKSIPSVWDETIVLPVSEIGQVAVFARRAGNRWFLAILNGAEGRTVRISLSFLGNGRFQALLVRDSSDEAATVKVEDATVSGQESLDIALRPGGGFVGRFSP